MDVKRITISLFCMGNSKSAMTSLFVNRDAKEITRRYAKHKDVTEDPSLVQNMVKIVQTTAPTKRRNKIAKLRKAISLPPGGLSKNAGNKIAQQVRALYKVGNREANQENRQTLLALFGNPSSPNSFVNALDRENMGTYKPIQSTGVRVTKQLASAPAKERPVLSEISTGDSGTISENALALRRQAALKKSRSTVRKLMSQQGFNALDVAKYASTNIKTLLGKKEKDAAAAEQIRLRLKQLSSSATNVNGMKKELGIQNLSTNNAYALAEIIMKEQLRRQREGEGINKKLANLARNVASMSAGLGSKLANTRSEQLEGFLTSRARNTNRLKVIKEALQKHVLGVTYPNEDDFKKAKAVISFEMLPSLSQKSFRDGLREEIRSEKIVEGQKVYFAKLPIYPLFESYDKLYDSIKTLNSMNANTALNRKSMQIRSIAGNLSNMNRLQSSLLAELKEDLMRAKAGQKERRARNAKEIGKIENANLARQARAVQNKQLQRNTVQVYNAAGSNIEIPSITFQNMIAKGIDGRWVLGQTNEFNGGQTPKWFTINKGNSRGYSLTANAGNAQRANAGNAQRANAGNVQRANANNVYQIYSGNELGNKLSRDNLLKYSGDIPPRGLNVLLTKKNGGTQRVVLTPQKSIANIQKMFRNMEDAAKNKNFEAARNLKKQINALGRGNKFYRAMGNNGQWDYETPLTAANVLDTAGDKEYILRDRNGAKTTMQFTNGLLREYQRPNVV